MKLSTFLKIFFLTFSIFLSCLGCKNNSSNKIIVYANDSFVSDWGAAPELEKLFEEKYSYDLQFVSQGGANEVLSKAILEKNNPHSDVILGIDNLLYQKAISENIFQPYLPKNAHRIIPQELFFDLEIEENFLTPYDWSTFAIMFDSEATFFGEKLFPPKSLNDLLNEQYYKKLILMDPRTSTPGLAFVAWTLVSFGDEYLNYWQNLKDSILTMAPGWDTGYGLFSAGEAPLVVSYSSSEAYHIECDNTTRYQALEFNDGHPFQVEGAGITFNAKNPEGAKLFLDFLISKEAQNIIPKTQWMYPVNKNVELPNSFSKKNLTQINTKISQEELDLAVKSILQVLSE